MTSKEIARNFRERNREYLREKQKLWRAGLDYSHLKPVKVLKGRKPLPQFQASFNKLFWKYKESAQKRKLLFDLSSEQFRKITSSKCFYCNKTPSKESKNYGQGKYNGHYLYNGIDRVDNKEGYIYENCVACCETCNYAKGSLSQKDFLEMITKICKHLKL